MLSNLIAYLGYDHPLVRQWLKFRANRLHCHLRCGPYAWDLSKNGSVIRIEREQFSSVLQLARDFDELFEVLTPVKAGNQAMLDFSRVHLHTYRDSGLAFELARWPEPDVPLEAYFDSMQPGAGELVFDLGADCGISAYGLSILGLKVVAFERDARTRVILERNVARHDLKNVTVARESARSIHELMRLHGVPVFCKLNLDRLGPEFLAGDEELLASQTIYFAARGSSRRARSQFASIMKKARFEIYQDKQMEVVWARPV